MGKLQVSVQAAVSCQGGSFFPSGPWLTPQTGCFLFSPWMGRTSPTMLPCSILILQATHLSSSRKHLPQVPLKTTNQDSGESRAAGILFYTTASPAVFPPCPSPHDCYTTAVPFALIYLENLMESSSVSSETLLFHWSAAPCFSAFSYLSNDFKQVWPLLIVQLRSCKRANHHTVWHRVQTSRKKQTFVTGKSKYQNIFQGSYISPKNQVNTFLTKQDCSAFTGLKTERKPK